MSKPMFASSAQEGRGRTGITDAGFRAFLEKENALWRAEMAEARRKAEEEDKQQGESS